LYQSTTPTISISLPVGTYNFSVVDISGYNASPKSGNVTAILDPIKLTTITFSPSIPEFNINPATLDFLILVTLFFSQFITKKKKDSKTDIKQVRIAGLEISPAVTVSPVVGLNFNPNPNPKPIN
jgi:hypothetical protein